MYPISYPLIVRKTSGFLFSCTPAVSCLLLASLNSVVWASTERKIELDTCKNKTDKCSMFSSVLVKDTSIYDASGLQVLNAQQIADLPTGTGNLSDVLKVNPTVDFSRSGQGSANSGVMRPEEFSFHGQAYYQNLFMIDGIDTGSDLNPGSGGDVFSTPSLTGVVGGSSPQGYYVDANLLDSIEIYDSNVPAKFGGFTGGVVNSKMKRYAGVNYGELRYGIQRHQWESFHIDSKNEQKFDDASGINAAFTPEYRKDNYSASLQQSLTENSGLTLSMSRKNSEFKQSYKDAIGEQQPVYYNDRIDNMSGRVDYLGFDDWDLGVSFRYAEREHDGITSPAYRSKFTKAHTGMGLGTNLAYRHNDHELNLNAALDVLSDEMNNESRVFENHPAFRGTFAGRFGGFGDIKQQQTRFILSPEWALPQWQWGEIEHKITVGSTLSHTRSYYERPEDVEYLNYNQDETLKQRTIYGAGQVSLNYLSTAFYLEDQVNWYNVDLRLGLRADRNTWLNNWDLAPRLSVDWDVFGSGNTQLQAGANRYYGRSFLRYAINDKVNGWRSTINYNADGSIDSTIDYSDRSGEQPNLKSPYSDEYMLGWVQNMGPLTSRLQWVHRETNNEVQRERDGNSLSRYVNSGTSKTDNITLSLSNQAYPFELLNTSTVANLSVGWKQTTSNRQGEDAYDQDISLEPIYYQGRLVDAKELPAWDFNTPFTVRLSSVTKLPSVALTWSNFVHYRQGGTLARYSGEQQNIDGKEYDIYEDVKLGNLVTLDTSLQWRPALFSSVEGYMMIEVSNLFNDYVSTSTSRFDVLAKDFSAGRKMWLEVGMRF